MKGRMWAEWGGMERNRVDVNGEKEGAGGG
jgi:hypothetical protein